MGKNMKREFPSFLAPLTTVTRNVLYNYFVIVILVLAWGYSGGATKNTTYIYIYIKLEILYMLTSRKIYDSNRELFTISILSAILLPISYRLNIKAKDKVRPVLIFRSYRYRIILSNRG